MATETQHSAETENVTLEKYLWDDFALGFIATLGLWLQLWPLAGFVVSCVEFFARLLSRQRSLLSGATRNRLLSLALICIRTLASYEI